jgi:hypothetical protein
MGGEIEITKGKDYMIYYKEKTMALSPKQIKIAKKAG